MERLPTPPGERTDAPDAPDAFPGAAYTATATVDGQGLVTGWSEGARRLLGYGPQEVVGRPAARLLDDTAARRAGPEAAGQEAAGRERWSGVVTLRHRDGRRLRRELLAHRLTSPGPAAEWLLVSAVAGRPHTTGDETLREWVFRQSPCVLAVFDTDLRLVRANSGMEQALLLTEEQMRGLRLPEIAPHPVSEETEAKMRLVLAGDETQQVDARVRAAGAAQE